ncbi:transmembrane protein 17B-like [Gymnogyps californianus]|uniref:transmembrane protein 17B-like n=1 Tax=Gymnogyps californianus TaxID=33616 RepID=UPI0021C6AB35|nr:transmembrane protein 17B-like [Gymnogyps californianus]
MAAHTPLPPNLRRGLAVFSSSLFINNKTWDSGAAHTYHPAHEVLASLPLQMMLYFNVYYFPVWCLAEGMMLQLKYHLLPWHYQFLLAAAFLILSLAEGSRLYLGYVGNLQEKVPELAGFLLLSFLIQLPLLLFLLTDSHIIRLPLEMAMHSLFLAFLVAEITAAFLALKTMTKQLAARFYLRQFKEGSRGWSQELLLMQMFLQEMQTLTPAVHTQARRTGPPPPGPQLCPHCIYLQVAPE